MWGFRKRLKWNLTNRKEHDLLGKNKKWGVWSILSSERDSELIEHKGKPAFWPGRLSTNVFLCNNDTLLLEKKQALLSVKNYLALSLCNPIHESEVWAVCWSCNHVGLPQSRQKGPGSFGQEGINKSIRPLSDAPQRIISCRTLRSSLFGVRHTVPSYLGSDIQSSSVNWLPGHLTEPPDITILNNSRTQVALFLPRSSCPQEWARDYWTQKIISLLTADTFEQFSAPWAAGGVSKHRSTTHQLTSTSISSHYRQAITSKLQGTVPWGM